MNGDSIIISKSLFESVMKENARLKKEIEELKGIKQNKPMEGQISIEEYTKRLSLSKKPKQGGK